MKTEIAVLLMAATLTAKATTVCKDGCVAMEGVCACDAQPKDPVTSSEVQPSSEKPSHHPEPAWERGEVHADIVPQPPVAHDTKAEAEGR